MERDSSFQEFLITTGQKGLRNVTEAFSWLMKNNLYFSTTRKFCHVLGSVQYIMQCLTKIKKVTLILKIVFISTFLYK